MAKKLSKEEWERRINEAGAGRYEFVRLAVDGEFGSKKKCVVRCLVDNYVWSAEISNLVNGGWGCPNCSRKRRWTAEERIEQINSIDNISFISWVDEYKNAFSKALVRCSVDNYAWSASVNDFVNNGIGCPQCQGKRRWKSDERIEQINSLENILFLSWVGEFNGGRSKANVRCSLDNYVWSAAVNDLVNGGKGCPSCANGGYDPSKAGFIYALRSECGMYVKIGISNDPKRRHKELEKRTPFKFNLVEQISGDGAKIAELEKYFHEKYERAGFVGFDGCTEWLICTPQLLEELRELEDVK